jgi:hypothetical protein
MSADPGTGLPHVDGPHVDGPDVDCPHVDGSDVDGSHVDGSDVDGPGVDRPVAAQEPPAAGSGPSPTAGSAEPDPAAGSAEPGPVAGSGRVTGPVIGAVQDLLARCRARPDVLLVLAWYCATRVWGAVLIRRAADGQLPSVWTGPRSAYLDIAQLWDGQWYKIIAESGYPLPLPADQLGVVQQNAWAFFPGFPYTVQSVMVVTGLPFGPAAIATNLVLGACAVVVVMRVIRMVAGRRAAVGGAVLLCAFPSAPTLQIAYSESLALLLLALSVQYLLQHRYGWCLVAVLALALTRPVVAPFALVVLAHLAGRLRASRGWYGWGERPRESFRAGQVGRVVLLGLVAAGSSLLWPALVGFFTGSADAYERTQAAWRSGGVVQPFKQAVGIAHLLWGEHGGWWLLLGGALLVVLVVSPWGRRLGPELGAWTVAYPLYLVAVTEPWTSTFRYLLLMFPLLALVAVAVRRSWPVLGLAAVGLWLQWVWIHDLLIFTPPTDFPP